MAEQIPFINGVFYHICNRGTRKGDIFFDEDDYRRWNELLYWCMNYDYTYSEYLARIKQARSEKKSPADILDELDQNYRLKISPVEIIAYVHMPNHYHLLLKQIIKNGISRFMQRVATAYAKYINKKYNMSGSLYQGPMKAVMIRSNPQLVSVARYLHINPIPAGLVTIDNLDDYPWSSFSSYTGEKDDRILTKKHLLDLFDGDIGKLNSFTRAPFTDRRDIKDIKGLTIDDDYGWFQR